MKHIQGLWLTATLLSVNLFAASETSKSNCLSCECILPEQPIEKEQCGPAYNLPASIQVANEWEGDNSLFIEASYTYWYAGEDGLDLGRSGDFLVDDDPFYNPSNTILSQPFQYDSGFQVKAGWIKEDWQLAAEYTWVRNTISQNSGVPNSSSDLGTGVWVIAPWFLQLGQDGGSLSGTKVASKWHLGMDIADLTLSRPYYLGRHLIMTPYGGLRSAWIRQKMNVAIFEPVGLFPELLPQPITSTNGSHSWSIGPRFGTEAHVLLGADFRIEADVGLSLLFTKYTKVFHHEAPAMVDAFPGSISVSDNNQTALRPVLECGLGLGWGRYISDNRYHIDFSADYDFMLWWNQNMMRKLVNTCWNGTYTNGDLYLHGLTLSGTFAF